MKIAFVALNPNFCGSILEELESKHTVKNFRPSGNMSLDYFNLMGLINWCDLIYCDFIQTPMPEITQMQSLSLDIVNFLLLGRLRVYPIETGHLDDEAPLALLKALRNESDRDMIIIDSLTSAVGSSSLSDILRYFEGCKRLCADGRTLLVVLHSHGLSQELTIRIRSICDAHLRLRTEEVGQKLVKTLEVTKIRGADKTTGNIVSFEVEPGWGMRIIPITKVRG